MSRYFVSDPPVPIYEFDPLAAPDGSPPPNVIWIRAKMDLARTYRIRAEIQAANAAGELGSELTLLFIHNIVKWEGPDFDSVPCDAEHISALDPMEPHLDRVADAIAVRNTPKAPPSPKLAVATGLKGNGSTGASPASAGGLSHQLATTTPRSSLRAALDGHLSKPDGSTLTS